MYLTQVGISGVDNVAELGIGIAASTSLELRDLLFIRVMKAIVVTATRTI